MAQVACQKNITAPSCHSALPAHSFYTDIGAFAASLKVAQHWPTPVPPLYLLYQPTRRNSPTLNRLRKRYVTNCVFIQHLLVFFLLSSRHNWRIYFFMPPPTPHFSSLFPVDCHWAEITPVLLTLLGTRVKHTWGETWWGSFAESH